MKLPSPVLPFASITERPYDQALLKSVDWYAIEPTYVQLCSIHLTQTHCTIPGLFGQRYSTDPHVRLVHWEERLYCEDGHHRLVRHALHSDQPMTQARVLTIGLYPYDGSHPYDIRVPYEAS